jgi:hypothetical protein
MTKIDNLRNQIIGNILKISDETELYVLNKTIVSIASNHQVVKLSREQKFLLQLGLDDMAAGNTISDKKVNEEELEWLNSL